MGEDAVMGGVERQFWFAVEGGEGWQWWKAVVVQATVRWCLKEGGDVVVEDDAAEAAMAWARWRLGIVVVDGGSSNMAVEVEGDWEL